MTRKRYVKLLMAAGAGRNTAEYWALANRLSKYAYSEMAGPDAATCRIMQEFGLSIKRHLTPIRPVARPTWYIARKNGRALPQPGAMILRTVHIYEPEKQEVARNE